MSKLMLSNDKNTVFKVKEKSILNGFIRYNDLYKSNLNLISFKKLNIDNENFIHFDNDDFIVTAGSLIYKEEIGKQCLENIYNDFNGKIQDIRDNTIGNYLLCIRKNNMIYIFCEENNLFNVFYSQNKEKWIVSNSLYDIADNFSRKLSVNNFNLIEYTFQSGIIGNGTIFNEIKKLQGNEYLNINLEENIIQVLKIKSPKIKIRNNDIDLLAKKFSKKLKTTTGIIAKVFNSHTISMTGGVDARMIFASMLANNIKPNLVYGVGNTVLTSTKERDLEINKIYANRYHLNFHTMNWHTPAKFDQYWKKYMKKYGILSLIYNASDNIFNELENIKSEFIDFGYFGEPFRNVTNLINLKKNNFTIEEFIDDLYLRKSIKNILPNSSFNKFREVLINKFCSICTEEQINYKNISVDDFQVLHNEYRKSADAKALNFMNYHNYSISILSQKNILDFSSISKTQKKDVQFILKSLKNLYPDVLNVPFYSHNEDYIFDKNKIILVKKNNNSLQYRNLKKKIKNIIRNQNIIKVMERITLKIEKYGLSSKIKNEKISKLKIENDLLQKIINNEYNIVNINNYQGNIGRLAHYSQMLEIIKEIKNKE